MIADTLYHTDVRLEGIIANSLVTPYDQAMFWRDYSRIYEIEVFAPDIQIQCKYSTLLMRITTVIVINNNNDAIHVLLMFILFS